MIIGLASCLCKRGLFAWVQFVRKPHQISIAPLLGEWLKPLSNFKHKKTQAHWPGDLLKLKCNLLYSRMRKSEYMKLVFCYCFPKLYPSFVPLMNGLWNTWVRCVPDAVCPINNMQPCLICDRNTTEIYRQPLRTYYISTDPLTELSVCSTTPKRIRPHTAESLFLTGVLECAKPHYERMAVSLFDCALCTGKHWTKWRAASTGCTVKPEKKY